MGLLSDDDVGKSVFDDEGNLLGKILRLEEYGATVEPAADANPETLDPYEWETAKENRLSDDQVERVDNDGVYVRRG